MRKIEKVFRSAVWLVNEKSMYNIDSALFVVVGVIVSAVCIKNGLDQKFN